MEHRLADDHKLSNDTYDVKVVRDNQIITEQMPALNAINMRLRDDYVNDASGGLNRWNRTLKRANIDFTFTLPHEGFNRSIGVFSAVSINPQGDIISADEWASQANSWLPSTSDAAFIQSLMKPCFEAGQYASWIAPPKVGINNQPGDFEYVQLHMA